MVFCVRVALIVSLRCFFCVFVFVCVRVFVRQTVCMSICGLSASWFNLLLLLLSLQMSHPFVGYNVVLLFSSRGFLDMNVFNHFYFYSSLFYLVSIVLSSTVHVASCVSKSFPLECFETRFTSQSFFAHVWFFCSGHDFSVICCVIAGKPLCIFLTFHHKWCCS